MKTKIPPTLKVHYPKFKAAIKLIEEKGMKVSPAFLAAGYKKSYALRAGSEKNLRPIIKSAQENFVDRFMANAEKIGLTAEKTSAVLNTIVDTGDEQAKIGAIREHHKVILTTLAISARAKSPLSGMTLNHFSLPSSNAREEDWKSAAIEAQREESAAASSLGADAPGGPSAEEGAAAIDASRRQPKAPRSIIHTAKYKAGRSQAIKRGHATRKRNARKLAQERRDRARSSR